MEYAFQRRYCEREKEIKRVRRRARENEER
jgi:hypothetical protein